MISLTNVHRHYIDGGRAVRAVDGVSLTIAANEFVALTGPSGCGKSTLMHLIAGIDRPTSGEVFVGDLALHEANENALTHYRRRDLGIVFQFFNLLPTMSALENVMFPLLLLGASRAESEKQARAALDRFEIGARSKSFPHQLSGGEQQRTAIARALVHEPKVLIADEPTGNLDSAAAESVMDAIRQIAADRVVTILVVTHSEEIARNASRRLHMRDGKIASASPEATRA